MGAKFTVQIQSILGGKGSLEYMPGKAQFFDSVGIDPEFALDGTHIRPGGAITPNSLAKFSGTNVNGQVIAIITTPKNTNTYAITSTGRLISYPAGLGSEVLVATVAGGGAGGGAYYNNYIYIFGTGSSGTDVSRYGPLDGSPSLADGVWTGSTLGSQTALTNTAYPNLTTGIYPNHWGHVHSDNKLYFCDYAAGQGMIHCIKTKKTTAEGDTNDGSAFNVLTLPFGMHPIDIESYGINLAVIAFRTTDGTVLQGSPAMYVWDATSANFQIEVPIPAAFAGAIINKNGELYIFAGDLVQGYMLLKYAGGYSFTSLFRTSIGYTPFPGAVDIDGNRIMWGSNHSLPQNGASIFALGYRDGRLGSTQIHNIAQSSSTSSRSNFEDCSITALKRALQNEGLPVIVGQIGYNGSPTYGIDSWDQTALNYGIFMSEMFTLGARFSIDKIRIPLSKSVASGTEIDTYLVTDGPQVTTLVRSIVNSTHAGKLQIVLYPNVVGNYSFLVEFVFRNSGGLGPSVLLPVTIEGTILDD